MYKIEKWVQVRINNAARKKTFLYWIPVRGTKPKSFKSLYCHHKGGALHIIMDFLSGTFVMQVRTLLPSKNVSHDEHVPCLHWKLSRKLVLAAANERGDPGAIVIFWLLSLLRTSTSTCTNLLKGSICHTESRNNDLTTSSDEKTKFMRRDTCFKIIIMIITKAKCDK